MSEKIKEMMNGTGETIKPNELIKQCKELLFTVVGPNSEALVEYMNYKRTLIKTIEEKKYHNNKDYDPKNRKIS